MTLGLCSNRNTRVIFTLLLMGSVGVLAQPEHPKRPTIGIAFEGGGALGLAHIGVLEWFEEHHIPVDYIAGTSMGGLVGGLYATGLRATELQDFVATLNWQEILSGQPTYRNLAYRRKEDARTFQNYLEFGLRRGINAPGGLNDGQHLTYLFDRLALPYSDVSFDELPIPFRTVATDLVTGKPHIFKDGPLGEALRSTMSLPAVFTPVTRDGKIYADGGLINNLPVDLVKQMGADIVIAVTVKSAPYDPKNGQSMFSVMGRSIGVMIEANELRNAELSDIMIAVDLTQYASTDYPAWDKIIRRGYDGAARKSSVLLTLALDEARWEELLTKHASRRRPAEVPKFVEVKGVQGALAEKVQSAVSDQVGSPLDSVRLEHSLTLMEGTRRFSSFSYYLTRVEGEPGLVIHADENHNAPLFLKLGMLIDGSDYNNAFCLPRMHGSPRRMSLDSDRNGERTSA